MRHPINLSFQVKGQSFGGAMILTAQPKNDAGCSIHENADTGPSLRRDRHTERSVCGLLRVHTLVLTRFIRGG